MDTITREVRLYQTEQQFKTKRIYPVRKSASITYIKKAVRNRTAFHIISDSPIRVSDQLQPKPYQLRYQ